MNGRMEEEEQRLLQSNGRVRDSNTNFLKIIMFAIARVCISQLTAWNYFIGIQIHTG